MISLWKDSREEVWYCGESLVRSLNRLVLVSSAMSFSLVFVSECKQVIRQLH